MSAPEPSVDGAREAIEDALHHSGVNNPHTLAHRIEDLIRAILAEKEERS